VRAVAIVKRVMAYLPLLRVQHFMGKMAPLPAAALMHVKLLQPRNPQPQRIADDADGRQRHRRGGDDR